MTIAKDGLLVVIDESPTSPVDGIIVIPRQAIDGLMASLHLKLGHPTCHQLKQVAHRYFFALDMDLAIETVNSQCHMCTSVSKLQRFQVKQSTTSPPKGIGFEFACDVLRRETQFIMVLREIVTSYTWSKIIADEKKDTLLPNLLQLLVPVKPIEISNIIVRVDPAPGFKSMKNDPQLL